MFRTLHCVAFVAVSLIWSAASARVQVDYVAAIEPRRLALVVGNGAYRNFGPLPGALTDATKMRDRLHDDLGFDVDLVTNSRSFDEFVVDHLQPFAAKIREGDLVVLYFSGHGFAHGHTNYLVPTLAPKSVRPAQLDEAFLPESAVRQFILDRQPGVVLVFLDACHTYAGIVSDTAPLYTPVATEPNDASVSGMVAPTGAGSELEGLRAPAELSPDVLVGFAAAPGAPAIGLPAGQTSRYTTALLDYLHHPGWELARVRREVIYAVRDKTEKVQSPWFSDSFVPEVFLKPTDTLKADLRASWEATLAEGRREGVEKYLAFNRVGPYAAAARRWLKDNAADTRLTFSQVSPLLPELAWRAGADRAVAFARFADGLAVPRTLDLTDALEVPATLEAAGSERLLALQGQAFVTQKTLAMTDLGGRTLPRGAPLAIDAVRGGSVRAYAKARSDDDAFAVILPVGQAPPAFQVGTPLTELSLRSTEDGPASIVDAEPLRVGLAALRAQGKTVGWVSISTPRAGDARGQDLLSLQALYVKHLLKGEGVQEAKISTLEAYEAGPSAVRVRIFGY